MIEKEEKVLITGCYIRVSTEEQAREGFSIKAQIENESSPEASLGVSVALLK